MPSFDVTSEVDLQEVRNAVDQASREVATRFDFKDTGAGLELKEHTISLHAPTPDRLKALVQVLEEKLVRRQVSLKALHYGKVEEGARGSVRQAAELNAGISSEHARRINKIVKDIGLKGISSQTQGDQVRVTGKKRDELQQVIAEIKKADLDIPLQFGNFRE